MKLKYFNISENQDGTYKITTKKGRILDVAAKGYEINAKQPKFIKIRHDGGAWCSVFNEHGSALKDTMWVNDVILNDDGSYRIQEYVHDNKWKYYDNGASTKRFWNRYSTYISGVFLSGIVLTLNVSSKAPSDPKRFDKNTIQQIQNRSKKISSSVTQPSFSSLEHVRE